MTKTHFSSQSGLGLPVIIVIIAVLAILAGVAVPKFFASQTETPAGEEHEEDMTMREGTGPAVPSQEMCHAQCRDQYGGSGSPGFDACIRACGAGAEISGGGGLAGEGAEEIGEATSGQGEEVPAPSTSTPTPGTTSPEPSSPSQPPTVSVMNVTIQNFAYNPKTLTIPAGTTVTFTNMDSVGHTATQDGGGFDTGMIAPGQFQSVIFSESGTYAYHCTPHPGMKATIIVE